MVFLALPLPESEPGQPALVLTGPVLHPRQRQRWRGSTEEELDGSPLAEAKHREGEGAWRPCLPGTAWCAGPQALSLHGWLVGRTPPQSRALPLASSPAAPGAGGWVPGKRVASGHSVGPSEGHASVRAPSSGGLQPPEEDAGSPPVREEAHAAGEPLGGVSSCAHHKACTRCWSTNRRRVSVRSFRPRGPESWRPGRAVLARGAPALLWTAQLGLCFCALVPWRPSPSPPQALYARSGRGCCGHV